MLFKHRFKVIKARARPGGVAQYQNSYTTRTIAAGFGVGARIRKKEHARAPASPITQAALPQYKHSDMRMNCNIPTSMHPFSSFLGSVNEAQAFA